MHHLQAALSKAEEEVAQLRDQLSQLQTQANKLFESSPPQGMLSHHISIRCSWTWLFLESRDVGDIRGYIANTPRSAQSTLNNVQNVSFLVRGLLFFISNQSRNRRLQRGRWIQRRLRWIALTWNGPSNLFPGPMNWFGGGPGTRLAPRRRYFLRVTSMPLLNVLPYGKASSGHHPDNRYEIRTVAVHLCNETLSSLVLLISEFDLPTRFRLLLRRSQQMSSPGPTLAAVFDPVTAYSEGQNGSDFQIRFQYTVLWQGHK